MRKVLEKKQKKLLIECSSEKKNFRLEEKLGVDKRSCLLIKPGILDYKKALNLQESIFKAKKEGKIEEEVLIFLQHPPTITIGKKGSLNEILMDTSKLKQKGISIYNTGRGGRVTYHGPGQIVGYPIFDLRKHKKDLHLYLRNLEEVIIKSLSDFGVKAGRKKGLTGVWVNEKKIASIGVQVKNWISMHGFALNVNCDLSYFKLIQPCGMQAEVMTSLNNILQNNVEIERVEESLVKNFKKIFHLTSIKIDTSFYKSYLLVS